MHRCAILVIASLLLMTTDAFAAPPPKTGPAFTLLSPAFNHGNLMNSKYTCEGENISPPLKWVHVPKGTKSLVLIMDDPDAPDPAAPEMIWVHWVIYNLPPKAGELKEGQIKMPKGAVQGLNDFRNTGYGGPCPPTGLHRYFFRLYALDIKFDKVRSPTRTGLLRDMEGHIIGRAITMGSYQKRKR